MAGTIARLDVAAFANQDSHDTLRPLDLRRNDETLLANRTELGVTPIPSG